MNGVLLVDKPQDITSHDVVYQVKKHLNAKLVGHAGTLDPLATGLMVVLVGEATKLSNYLLDGDKAYEAEIELGKVTDTLDIKGKVLKLEQKFVDFDQVKEAALSLQGTFTWDIPMYSAKKINGKKLYELAREDIQLAETPQKQMTFYSVEILSYDFPYLRVQLHCSKGSFIRTWANELGKALGTGACLSALRRVYSAPYRLDKAINLDTLAGKDLHESFIPLSDCLRSWPILEVSGLDEHLVRNGQLSQNLKARMKVIKTYSPDEDLIRFRVESKTRGLLALAEIDKLPNYRLLRVFRT